MWAGEMLDWGLGGGAIDGVVVGNMALVVGMAIGHGMGGGAGQGTADGVVGIGSPVVSTVGWPLSLASRTFLTGLTHL